MVIPLLMRRKMACYRGILIVPLSFLVPPKANPFFDLPYGSRKEFSDGERRYEGGYLRLNHLV
jgi:hypothetical protein